MARYDKYDPISGGFRAKLAADWANGDVGKPIGVGLNANGQVVKGAGNTGILGVLCEDGERLSTGLVGKKAGTVVDVMTSGEIVDCTGLTAGTKYAAATADGAIGATGSAIGHTVEASRLVVRVTKGTLP